MGLNDKCLHQILYAGRWRNKTKMEVIKAFSLAGKLAPLSILYQIIKFYIYKNCETKIHGERPGGRKNL